MEEEHHGGGKMKNILETYVNGIKNIFGEKLKLVVLYGSQASGEATKKYSDYNLLLIVDELKHQDLKFLSKISKKWLKYNNPPPVIFTSDKFRMSFDVFPIEFLDMKEHRKILYGEDPFEKTEISLENLKHECEFELKGKLLKLQQGYILAQNNSRNLTNLMLGSISSILVLFRNIVRLSGKTPPSKKVDALNVIEQQVKVDTEPFITILKMKDGEKQRQNIESLFEAYINQIEKVVDFVDKFIVK